MNQAEPIKVENAAEKIVLHNVSKFYGDILGVNRVSIEIGARAIRPHQANNAGTDFY